MTAGETALESGMMKETTNPLSASPDRAALRRLREQIGSLFPVDYDEHASDKEVRSLIFKSDVLNLVDEAIDADAGGEEARREITQIHQKNLIRDLEELAQECDAFVQGIKRLVESLPERPAE